MPNTLPTSHEELRQRSLDDLQILDTPPQGEFDDMATLARQICGVPIALVSFVDRRRQWFKACLGLAVRQTDRADSFCAHAIDVPDEVFIVPDARADARFAANRLVTGEPFIRFYAGAPIVMADGTVPGTVCVIDTVPRVLDATQLQALRMLARQTAALLDLRTRSRQAEVLAHERDQLATQAQAERAESRELLEIVLRGGNLGLWDLDLPSGHWTINAREREMLGYELHEADPATLRWDKLIHPEDRPLLQTTFASHARGDTPYCESTHRMRHRDGSWVWVLDRSVILKRGADGQPVRVVGTHIDVTQQRVADEERRKNQERLELALSGGDIGLWDLDVASGTATYNAQWWAMFGYRPGEVDAVEGLWKDMVHPEDHEVSREALARHIFGETPMYESEVRVRHRDGRWLWVQNRAKVVERDPDGVPVRIVGVNLNVTDSKQVQLRLQAEQQRIRLITDNLPASVTHLDRAERFTFANKFAATFLGVDASRMLGRTIRDICGVEQHERLMPYVRQALNGHSVAFESEGTVNGKRRFTQSNYVPDFNADGEVQGFYAMTFDVTEGKEAELRKLDSERRLRGLTDTIPALLMELDPEGRVVFCNGRYQTWLGLPPSTLIGKPLHEAMQGRLYESQPLLERALAGEEVSFEQTETLLVGKRTLQTIYMPQRDSVGEVSGLYVLSNDVSELKRKQVQLDTLARVDQLTGLPNRRQAEERMHEAMARSRRSGVPVCLLFLDIDHFKQINDTLGHAGGDAVLVEFGARLKQCVREVDMPARYAGDEFLVLLEGVGGAAAAATVAAKIVNAMRPAFGIAAARRRVTTSIGVAVSMTGDNVAALLSRSDAALYLAKQQGRDRFVMAGPPLAAEAHP